MGTANKRDVLFLLTVDTEEEFDWNGEFPQENCAVSNIERIPALHGLCESLGIRPTYLVDYPVAANPASAATLRAIYEGGNAEIGAHLHPWCTPPISGPNGERESHVVNLAPDLVEAKLSNLLQAIQNNIGAQPTSFRTGRWGINPTVMQIIQRRGFTVDSSVYPHYRNEFFSCMDAYTMPYWPSATHPNRPGPAGDILEIPVTAGFNRPGFGFWGKVHQWLSSRKLEFLHPIGLAWHMNLLKKLYLSPELSSAEDMIVLVDAALKSGHPTIHMYLHSSTLIDSNEQFNAHGLDEAGIHRCIETVYEHVTRVANVTPCTLSEARSALTSGFAGYSPPVSNATS